MSTHAKEGLGSQDSVTCHSDGPRKRPLIVFFDYPDVFEDFYCHYDIDQQEFATRWSNTASHMFLSLLQREVGDVVWYAFSLQPEISETRHEVVGCRVKMLPSSWLHRRLWRLFYLPRAAWRWRRAYPFYATIASYVSLFSTQFLRTLATDRPDFFFVQDYATGRFDMLVMLARILGIPLITRHTGSVPEEYLGRAAKRWTIRYADRVIVSSQNELEMLRTRFRVPRERMSLILTPIDLSVFRPIARTRACDALELSHSRRYLLFVGRIDDKIKRVSRIIQTFATQATQHADVDLLIVGDGPDKATLRRQAEEQAPGRVQFLGWISTAQSKALLYNVAECLLLASRREGFPAVVGEAMACGTPVIASRVGGVGELVIDGQTGWSFPPDDFDLFRDHMAYVLNHRETIAAMRPQARAAAERRLAPPVVAKALRECFGMEK
jgi:glycosyltransferase involved in cell wall biosynthesis